MTSPSFHRLAVSAAFFANGFMVGSWVPQIPVFKARLGLTEVSLGLMILVFGVGAVVSMPVLGRVIGRIGSRSPMLGLHVGLALALPALAFAPSIASAVLAIVFAGVATGSMDVAMNANAVSVERRMDRAIMSSCHGFWSLGGLFGAGVGGFVIAGVGAVGHALLVCAVILALWPIVQRFALQDRVAPHQEKAVSAGETVSPDGLAPAPLFSGGYAKALGIGLFALFAMIPEGAAIDWSALYLRQVLGADAGTSGLAFAAFSFTMATFRFAGDGIRNRLGSVRTARLCSLAAGLGLLTVALANGTAMALLGFAVMGVGLSNIVPIAFSAAGNVEGLKPGVGLSLVTTLGYSGILVAPSAIGFIAENTGFPVVFAGLASLFLVTFLAASLVKGADRPGA